VRQSLTTETFTEDEWSLVITSLLYTAWKEIGFPTMFVNKKPSCR